MDAVGLSLALGLDPSRDVPLAGCRCGAEGHQLLGLSFERQSLNDGADARVWNNDLDVSRTTLRRLRQSGLAFVLAGREGGWPASWWSAQATPAGLRHAAQLAGFDAQHGSTCGGAWNTAGRCLRCGAERLLTIELARQRLSAWPDGTTREQEVWASQFVCPNHGRCRLAMVRTDKCCAWCGAMLVRSTPVEASL